MYIIKYRIDCPLGMKLPGGNFAPQGNNVLGYSFAKTGSKDVLGYPAVYRINIIIYAAYVAARFSRRYYHPHHYFDCDYHYGARLCDHLFVYRHCSLITFAVPTPANSPVVPSVVLPSVSPRSRFTRSSFNAEIELPEASLFVRS